MQATVAVAEAAVAEAQAQVEEAKPEPDAHVEAQVDVEPEAEAQAPLDAAVPEHLLVASHDKYNSPGKPRKSLGRDNSPIVSSSGFKHVMDAAALFKIVDASPPRGSPLAGPTIPFPAVSPRKCPSST